MDKEVALEYLTDASGAAKCAATALGFLIDYSGTEFDKRVEDIQATLFKMGDKLTSLRKGIRKGRIQL